MYDKHTEINEVISIRSPADLDKKLFVLIISHPARNTYSIIRVSLKSFLACAGIVPV